MVISASPPDVTVFFIPTEASEAAFLERRDLPREFIHVCSVLKHPPGSKQRAFCLCRYENCEMRTVIISDTSGESGGLDPLFFPGGHSIKGPANEPVQSDKGPAT